MIATVYKCSAWKVPKSEQVGLFVDLEAGEEAALVEAGFEFQARGTSVDPGEWFRMWVENYAGETELKHVPHYELFDALPKLPVWLRQPKKIGGLE